MNPTWKTIEPGIDFLKVTVQPEAGSNPVCVSVNVLDGVQAYYTIILQEEEKQWVSKWVEYLVSVDFPRLSPEEACKVYFLIEARLPEIKRQISESKESMAVAAKQLTENLFNKLKQIEEFVTEFVTVELPRRKKAGLIAKGGDGASATGVIPGMPRFRPPS